MIRFLAIALSFASVLAAAADEMRIARFDMKRVCEGYQHVKDLEHAISVKRHPMGPGSVTPGLDRNMKLAQRARDLAARLRDGVPGTPEHERLELQSQIAALELEIDNLRLSLENAGRAKLQDEETQRLRAEVLREISSAASRLGTERGYRILVFDHLPGDFLFVPTLVPEGGDDLTEPLLALLNEQYAAKKSK